MNVKTIEEEYKLYRGAIYRLGEGFSWLADSLAAIAENAGWKKKRKEDLNRIKLLSNRLILPSFPSKNLSPESRNPKPETCNLPPVSCVSSPPPRNFPPASYPSQLAPRTSQLKTENRELKTILQIDIHRPDRIIFEGKEVKVTTTEFSLIHLLALNRGKILTHNDLLDTIWKGDGEATYVQITYHLYKIRRNILKIIGKNKKNKEKVKDILKVVSRRGIMLNLAKNKLNII